MYFKGVSTFLKQPVFAGTTLIKSLASQTSMHTTAVQSGLTGTPVDQYKRMSVTQDISFGFHNPDGSESGNSKPLRAQIILRDAKRKPSGYFKDETAAQLAELIDDDDPALLVRIQEIFGDEKPHLKLVAKIKFDLACERYVPPEQRVVKPKLTFQGLTLLHPRADIPLDGNGEMDDEVVRFLAFCIPENDPDVQQASPKDRLNVRIRLAKKVYENLKLDKTALNLLKDTVPTDDKKLLEQIEFIETYGGEKCDEEKIMLLRLHIAADRLEEQYWKQADIPTPRIRSRGHLKVVG